MATIIVRLKERELQRVPVTCVATRIGRDVSNDVVIANDGISRHHATVRWEPDEGAFVIHDVSSSNGVYVRGRATPYARLADGDEVHLGKFTLVFEAAGGAAVEELAPEIHLAPATTKPVANPLPTVALPAAGGKARIAPATTSARPQSIGAVASSPPATPPPAAMQSAPPGADVAATQTRLLEQMMWLLVALVVLLCVLVAALLVVKR